MEYNSKEEIGIYCKHCGKQIIEGVSQSDAKSSSE